MTGSQFAPLEAKSLRALDGIRHGFFTRAGGVSSGVYADLNCGLGSSDQQPSVLQNRARVCEYLGGTSGSVVTLYQVHGTTALTVTAAPLSGQPLPKADAVVSNTPGLVIGVLTADCTPVLFADPQARVVAAAHAGWRGAVSGVLEAAMAEMERLGARRSRILAAIGPTIGQQAYEVGPDFEADVLARDPTSAGFFARTGAQKPHFDLPGYVYARLANSGLQSIELNAPCTYANESKFFSYRRSQHLKQPDYGRQISAIVVA